MRKDIFYICAWSEDRKSVHAEKKNGYSDGDVGVYKLGSKWYATHIPTGMGLIDFERSAQGAMSAGKKAMEREHFEDFVETFKKSPRFEQFSRSKYKQSVTEVF